MKIFLKAAFLAAFLMPVAAQAAEGFATANVNMRSGPSTRYPAVVVIPNGESVEIHGCLADTPWCDVSFYGGRGWVAGQYVQALYQRERVYIAPRYYRPLGIPTVTFNLGNYWDRNYRSRDFYRDRDYWRRGPDRDDRPRYDRDRPRFDRDPPRFDRDPPRVDRDRPRNDRDRPRVDRDRPRDNDRPRYEFQGDRDRMDPGRLFTPRDADGNPPGMRDRRPDRNNDGVRGDGRDRDRLENGDNRRSRDQMRNEQRNRGDDGQRMRRNDDGQGRNDGDRRRGGRCLPGDDNCAQ